MTEPAQKDVINALTVLANIASRSESHSMVSGNCILQCGVWVDVCLYTYMSIVKCRIFFDIHVCSVRVP